MREFITKLCRQESGVEVVAEAATGSDAIERSADTNPDALILDLGLPDIDGFQVLSRIRENGFRPRVVIISALRSPFVLFRVEQAGVHGFIDKRSQSADAVRQAIRALQSNGTYFSDSFLELRARRHKDPVAFDKLLTNQQIAVLSRVADFEDDAAIGATLGITLRTVEVSGVTSKPASVGQGPNSKPATASGTLGVIGG